MRRREFIMFAGSAVALPLAAHAQQPGMPVVGFLRSVSLADAADLVTAFRQGLKETGYIEGQNVAIELRSAEGHLDRLPALVADLIRRPVAVIVGNQNAAVAAKAATTTTPIIFAIGSDPVEAGIVASLKRPGGNITGVTFLVSGLGAKRLDLLRQLLPKATLIAMLVNPDSPDTEAERRDVQAAAQAIGHQLIILDASSNRDIETAFATFVQRGAGDLCRSLSRRGWWPDELRAKHSGCLSANRHLRRADSQGREAGRSSGHTVHKIRFCDQPQDRQIARARIPSAVARHRRRGDRIAMLFAAVHRSRLALSVISLHREIWSLLE